MPPGWRGGPELRADLGGSVLADAGAFPRAQPRFRAALECVLSVVDRVGPGSSLVASAARLGWFGDVVCDVFRDGLPRLLAAWGHVDAALAEEVGAGDFYSGLTADGDDYYDDDG